MTRTLPAPHLLLAVALGGACGGLLRWGCGELVGAGPATIFAINVSGSLLLALLPAFAPARRHRIVAVALGPGLLGGFTTLSAASEQTRALLDAGDPLLGGAYLLVTLAACLLAVALAAHLTRPADRRRIDPGGPAVTALLVAVGAGCGAALRFVVASYADRPGFALGTWAVNVVGSAVLGLLTGLAVGPDALALVGVGFCGGLTTYSSFAVQAHERGPRLGTAYVVATLAGALVACAAGFALGTALA